MLDTKQSLEQESSKITEEMNEVRETITDSSFTIRETCGPDDRNYEMRHYRGSFVRWQENGAVLINARSADMTPNEGYLDVKSTGYMHFKSGHNIKLIAEGHRVTGGGEGGADEEKSVEIFGPGDICIQSNGKGGVYISSAKDIELNAGGSIKLKAAEQISLNTGSQDPVPFGLAKSIGSGKLSISTGQYELSTTSFKETVTGSKMEENYGEVIQEQKMNILEPSALGPGAHITTHETQGTLHHKVGHDYILEVDGKMKVKVNNNPLKKVGPLQIEMPTEALKYEIIGSRTSTLLMDPLLQYSQDFVNIPVGNSYCQVGTAAPGLTAWSAGSLIKGDCVVQASAIGSIGLQTGPTPLNTILLQNLGGSVAIQATGAMGMISMIATKEIAGTALIIRLN
jgi:hypothetical protein